ncbi:imidazole glycerol phosphate synthase subunit HisH [Cylindrospermopsis raciborskii UAM/DH-MRr]|uniref:imidazole glycerol phosphate synthase subunit HisH n=1 Tax=Cylindrospermopsis raciborskii TaxID=77022 RepID=UPI00387A4314
MTTEIVVIDYGMGNLWSVSSALNYLGRKSVISGDPARVVRADALILPGVGSFRQAIEVLRANGLAEAITEAVLGRRRKILGICLGMQLFAESGSEDGLSQGLGFIPGVVDRFSNEELGVLKVPHIGFNQVKASDNSRLFQGLGGSTDFYFVHSYRLLSENLPGQSATCRYGVDFLAAYEHENIFATQFHPEKSQTNGLLLLKNFLDS